MKLKFDCIYRLSVLACILAIAPACSIDRDRIRGPETKVVGEPLNFKVNYVYRHGNQDQLKALSNGISLNSGDHYRIQFTPDEDSNGSFVYIFQIDHNSQNILQLFPTSDYTDPTFLDPVKLEHNGYNLPPSDEPFKLDKQRGTRTIYFMASRKPNEELDKQYKDYKKANDQNNSNLTKELVERFIQYLDKQKKVPIVEVPEQVQPEFKWSRTEKKLAPVQRLDNLCQDCVSVLTFEYR